MNTYILITGGTKGIGYAVAKILSQSGYHLVLTYNSDEKSALHAQAELKGTNSSDVKILQADITEKDSISKIESFLNENDIYLYSIVFNAGLTCRTSFEQTTIEEWEKVFFGNVHFPVFLLQRILPRILQDGNVLFTGSLMGIYAHSVSLAYGVSKSAVHALVQNLVKFLEPYKIRVNGIAPGFVDTEWQKNKPAEIRKNIENKIALGRFCNADELSEVYKMIIENKYFNGEIIVLSGGYSFK
ncbi:MAG TPA: SDR family oxidoreductase [Paludibacter sp.]|nr:SDR family oxidoreductase [Paludibacter sp.]